jgi:hypothetical protein
MTRTLRVATLMSVAALWANVPIHGATILPGIGGTVFQDSDSNGAISPGEGISGAVLQLYLDDGDGIFTPDAGDLQVGSDASTAADGSYAFGSLDPTASYFVRQPAQMLIGVMQPAQVSTLLQPGLPKMMIDSFSNAQLVTADPVTTIVTSTISDPVVPVLGGERDIHVSLLSGVGEVEVRAKAYGVEVLQYDTSAGVIGRGVVTWDGVDRSASLTPSLGLGDVDLTSGGTSTGLIMKLGIDATGVNDRMKIRIFTDSATEYSEATSPLPVTDGSASAYTYLPFSDFAGTATPDRVNAIQLWLGEGAKSVDAQIDYIGTLGPVVQDFAVVPEPAGVTLALFGLLGFVLRRRNRR